MIGLVIVSHSARLAEGVCELAAQAAHGAVPMAAAGGTGDEASPIGTDAFKVLHAIESVYSDDGVVVLMDLGSAILSAETALDLLPDDRRAHVHLSPAPLVEGAVAAAAMAAAGASLDEILRETLRAKAPAAEMATPAASADEIVVTVPNRLGLHARPAAQFVRIARDLRAPVTIENLTRAAGPSDAASISAVLALGARQGHQLRIRGPHEGIAKLAEFIASGSGDREEPEAPQSGQAASAGITIGPLVRFRPPLIEAAERTVDAPEAERDRFLAAVHAVREEMRALHGSSEIFQAHVLILEDPLLLGALSRAILETRVNAEFAWQTETRRLAEQLAALDDPYLRARAADIADVAARVAQKLAGADSAAPVLRDPSILSARDLTPSEVQSLDPAKCLGICLEAGSPLAHSMILARAMGIPAVVGLGPALSTVPDGAEIALDGERGAIWISPDPAVKQELLERRERWLAARGAAAEGRLNPAATRDGRRVRVFANISGVPEAAEAVDSGAEGVGVLRTEFLFFGRQTAPSENEQFAAYKAIAQSLAGRPLVIRTLDIGGDKSLPYVEIGAEANPFLGWRGIRVTLGRRDLFETQLRAILRCAAEYPLQILLPMIVSVEELRETRAMVRQIESELSLPLATKVGVMIEAPAAAAIADLLAREADFLSIGTNDLIQYVMAADRTNPRVAALADPFQPAVLRTVAQTIEAGRKAGIELTLCGELAADPLATPLLLGLGLEEFSVSPPLVPRLKQAIARCTIPEAEALARQAMTLATSREVRSLLAAG